MNEITPGDVVKAIVESIEFDAHTAENAGGTGVFAENPIHVKTDGGFALTLSNGEVYIVSVRPLGQST